MAISPEDIEKAFESFCKWADTATREEFKAFIARANPPRWKTRLADQALHDWSMTATDEQVDEFSKKAKNLSLGERIELIEETTGKIKRSYRKKNPS